MDILGYQTPANINWMDYDDWGISYFDQSEKKQALISNLENGSIVVINGACGSFDFQPKIDGKQTLIGCHVHAVLGYDAATDKFIIANPWGPKNNLKSKYLGRETSYMDQFSLSFEDMINGTTKNDIYIMPNIKWDSNGYYSYNTAKSDYTITNNAPTPGSALTEGEILKYTITRNNSEEEEIVYLVLGSNASSFHAACPSPPRLLNKVALLWSD